MAKSDTKRMSSNAMMTDKKFQTEHFVTDC